VLEGHTKSVRSVAFSSDAGIVSGSLTDATGVGWIDGEVMNVLEATRSRFTSVSFSSDGRRVVSGSNENRYGCG